MVIRPGVAAVIFQDERVLLQRRDDNKQWGLPGGSVEPGESVRTAVIREVLEETGLEVEVGPMIDVLDRIRVDPDGRVRYHFVLIDYLCWTGGGALRAGSDVDAAIWADPDNLAEYSLTDKATSVIRRGMRLALEAPRPVR